MCWFKNEEDKKPEHFYYSKYSFADIPFLKRGLYHPKCHCREIGINSPSEDKIQLIIPENKKNYLFTKKLGWLNYMGYQINNERDKQNFLTVYTNIVKKHFVKSDYYKEDHTKYGYKINIKLDFPGYGTEEGELFEIESNFMIFPKGKLKMNTPIGGWQ